jgi:hypothetical protein
MVLEVATYSGVVQAVIMDGKRIESPASERDLWSLTYYAVPAQGIEVLLEVDATQKIAFQVSDQTWDLVPEVLAGLGATLQPRSEDMMPMTNFDYGSVVARTLEMH